jgi:thioredoxin reductase (NADPH)
MLVHRRAEYRGAPASVEKMKALVEAGKMREIIGKVTDYRADACSCSGASRRNSGRSPNGDST